MGVPKRFLFALLSIAMLALAAPVMAQTAETPAPRTAADIAPLSDEEVRRLLLERLVEEPKAKRGVFNPANAAYLFQRSFSTVRTRAGEVFGTFPELAALPAEWWKRMTKGRDGQAFGKFLIVFALSVVIGGLGAYRLRERLLRSGKTSLRESPAGQPGRVVWFLGLLFGEMLVVVALGAIATLVFFLLVPPDGRDRTLFFFFLAAILIVTAIIGISRTIFSPGNGESGHRVAAMTDAQAARLHRSISGTAAISVFAFFSCASFSAVGIGGDVHELLLVLVGAMTAILLSATLWGSRAAIATDILAGSPQPGTVRRLAARVWPSAFPLLPLILYAIVLIDTFLGGGPLYGGALVTIFVLLMAPIMESALSRMAHRLSERGEAMGTAIARVGRFALPALAVPILAAGWRLDFFAMTNESLGGRIAQTAVAVAITLFIAYTLWQAIRIAIDMQIEKEDAAFIAVHGADAMDAEQGGAGLSRARTLLPLAKRALMIVLGAAVLLIVLSEIGVNTGPLLAGAGVVGLAVGFGSQTLVRDIVTGFFFLMEDAFRLGEYLDVGSVKGTVEEISVRSMKLRHHRGALNTVPFGSVDVIQNFSRDWAIMKLRIRVPFETDLNKVRKLLKKVGQEMMNEEAIRDDFLQPFKAQGAVEVDDYGFVISTKFMCKPGKQFMIRRFAFQAMQDAFEAESIPFAKPQVRVIVETTDDAEERAGDALGAAAGAGAALVSREAPVPKQTGAVPG